MLLNIKEAGLIPDPKLLTGLSESPAPIIKLESIFILNLIYKSEIKNLLSTKSLL